MTNWLILPRFSVIRSRKCIFFQILRALLYKPLEGMGHGAWGVQSGHRWRFWFRTGVALSFNRVTGNAPVASGVSKFYEVRFRTMAVRDVCLVAGAEDRAMLGSNPRADAGLEAEWERSLQHRSRSRLFA